ncbi:MAG: hypothetical protein K1X39_05905 [Thermoflexales bacterium]|nr:hypothetical protein [Thermoflexales bacterium]
MFTLKTIQRVAIAALSVLALAACSVGGGAPIAIKDLPAYPGAAELKPGESRIAEQLQQNMANDSSARQASGSGGKTEQKAFRFPGDASWDKVRSFYTDKLKASGWSEGMGGVAGALANQALNQVNAQNDVFQSQIYSRGKQTLAIFRMADPTDKSQVVVIASLTTN